MKIAFVFPGQGSQKVGMGLELAQQYESARDIYKEADSILGFPLSSLCWYGPESVLNDTINTQPALYTHSMAALAVLKQQYPTLVPDAIAGHSMGEISAIAASGALNFADGLRLAQARGEAMKRAGDLSPGGMAAIMGLDIPTIEQICVTVSSDAEILQVANDNCPGQVVVSGSVACLDRAIPLLQQNGARRIVKLAVSIAAHSHLMRHAQDEFNLIVSKTPFVSPQFTIIGNVTASQLTTSEEIRKDLQDQLTHRVRWTDSILNLKSMLISNYLEIGTGSVLSGLIKRIDPSANTLSLGSPLDFDGLKSYLL